MIAEGAQESTGIFNTGILPGQNDLSQAATNSSDLGFLQVTPKFAVQNFRHYGAAIKQSRQSSGERGSLGLVHPQLGGLRPVHG